MGAFDLDADYIIRQRKHLFERVAADDFVLYAAIIPFQVVLSFEFGREGIMPGGGTVVHGEAVEQGFVYQFRFAARKDGEVAGVVALHAPVYQPDVEVSLLGVHSEFVAAIEAGAAAMAAFLD